MAMFALGVVPLMLELSNICENIFQVWFADDASGAGSFRTLKQWWDVLSELGPLFGYFPKASKTCLVVHPEEESTALAMFGSSGITITSEGKRHLGAAIGSPSFINDFVCHRVEEWREEIIKLASIASSQPHAAYAYAAFVHGTRNKWSYLCRTVPQSGPLLQPIEDAIHNSFIPAVMGRPPCSQVERKMLALPSKMGGLSLADPSFHANEEYEASKKVTSDLVQSIIQQDKSFCSDPTAPNPSIKSIKASKRARHEHIFEEVYQTLELPTRRLIDCACEPGASAWLSAVPLEEHGFCLDKGSFRDTLSLRYGWQLPSLSSKCACGTPQSVDHAMMCHKGGLPSLRHNEVRDLTAALLSEACTGVSIEPSLQSLEDEQLNHRSANCNDEARLDIRASDFWIKGREALFDVRVFYPIAPSYRQKDLAAVYRLHENEKKRCYGQRVRDVEMASFTPLVFASTGGMAKECTVFFKRLADILAEKKKIAFQKMMFLICCKISFSLLRSAIRAIRGTRSRPNACSMTDFHRMYVESHVQH